MRDQPQFTEGARVRLRATVDPSIYGEYACFGNEGVIGDVRKDRFGLPEVFITWDKNHWAYNGVGDCWTYEDHFESVKDRMSKQDKVQEIAAMFAQAIGQIMSEEEAPQTEAIKPADALRNRFLEAAAPFQQDTKGDEYTQAVEAVTDRLNGSAAFIVVGVFANDHPEAPSGILEPYAMGFSKIPEGNALVTAHMARVAANAHEHLALESITQMNNES